MFITPISHVYYFLGLGSREVLICVYLLHIVLCQVQKIRQSVRLSVQTFCIISVSGVIVSE